MLIENEIRDGSKVTKERRVEKSKNRKQEARRANGAGKRTS